jgi:hypothetical protein
MLSRIKYKKLSNSGLKFMSKMFLKIILLSIAIFGILAFYPINYDNIKKTSDNEGPLFKFNRISLPIYEAGRIGFIIDEGRYTGVLDSNTFLFKSGFYLSGYNESGELFVNGVDLDKGIQDYVKGTIENPKDSLGVYYNSVNSEHFGEEWQNWKSAAKLGAEFYDGDNDGIYNPIDKNSNNSWDEDEDRPALYGDVMVWSAFNDSISSPRSKSQGINIRQTIWGYKDDISLEKIVFIKYSIENSGTVSSILHDVIFSIAPNPYIGATWNDHLSTDSLNNSILTYTPYKDNYTGDEQIAFSTTMIQGPLIENYESGDKGYYLEGEELKQNEVSSYFNGNIIAGVNTKGLSFSFYPEQLRKIMLGELNIDPCDNFFANVFNDDCGNINKAFIYSGNPISENGWVNTRGSYKGIMLTTDYFSLEEGKPVDIIFAFVLGSEEEAVPAMKEAIKNSKELKYKLFDRPQAFPDVKTVTITTDESIELLWETDSQINFENKGYGYNLWFEGYEIHMYNSASTDKTINGETNKKLIAKYDMANGLDKIFIQNEVDYSIDVLFDKGTQINEYNSQKLLLTVSWDPFANEPLKKGKPYYFSITPYGIDYSKLKWHEINGSFLIPANASYGYFLNEPKIINDDKGNVGIVIGENKNDGFFKDVFTEHKFGNSDAQISYSVYEQDKTTDDLYELSFERMEAETYQLMLNLTNVSKNDTIFRRSFSSNYQTNISDIRDGFILNIDWIEPGKVNSIFTGSDKWFEEFDNFYTGVFYVGSDIKESQKIFPVGILQSRAISIQDLTDVELRFADSSKALRYVRTAVRYLWKGENNIDSGFVNVPVSAYRIDKNGDETKLSIGFIENGFSPDLLGRPDGLWNPGSDILFTKEYLVIFNNEYTEDINSLIAYTGNENKIANIAHGYMLTSSEIEYSDSIKAIARSPWFNAMYVVGFNTPVYQADFNPTGVLSIKPPLVLTQNDKYYFKVKKEKTLNEKLKQFDKINVYPNPLFGYNSNSGAYGYANDEPFVTFSNLPEKVNIQIYTLSGALIKTFAKIDNSASYRWDLKNESGMRIASGMYIAIVNVPNIGQRILKFAIIQPQKRVHYE